MSDEAMSNFTPRAQQVLALARKEADRFNHNFVGTEHLLLGLIRLRQGVAVNVLQKLGLDLETVRMEVEKQVGIGPDQKMIGNISYLVCCVKGTASPLVCSRTSMSISNKLGKKSSKNSIQTSENDPPSLS